MITEILHTTFLTADLGRARAFYEGVLGLLPNPEAGLVRPAHGGRDRHVALAVSDFAKLIARLNQAAVTYTLSKSGRRALFCRDPDQNALEFIAAD